MLRWLIAMYNYGQISETRKQMDCGSFYNSTANMWECFKRRILFYCWYLQHCTKALCECENFIVTWVPTVSEACMSTLWKESLTSTVAYTMQHLADTSTYQDSIHTLSWFHWCDNGIQQMRFINLQDIDKHLNHCTRVYTAMRILPRAHH